MEGALEGLMRSLGLGLFAFSLAAVAAPSARAESRLGTDSGDAITSFAVERSGPETFFVAMTTAAGATFGLATGPTPEGTPGIVSPPGTARRVVLARSPGGDLHLAYGSTGGEVTALLADVGAPPSWQVRSRRESVWGAEGALAIAIGARPVLAMTLAGSVQVGDADGPRGAFDTPEATGEAALGRLGDKLALVYPTRGGAQVEYLTSDGKPSGAAPTRVPLDTTSRSVQVVSAQGGALIVARPSNPMVEPTSVVRLAVDGALGPTRTLPSGTGGLVADAYTDGGPDVHVLRYEKGRLTDTSWNAIERATSGEPAVGANVASATGASWVTGACNERACLYGFVERGVLRTFSMTRAGEVTESTLAPPPSSGPGGPQYGPTNACSSGGAPTSGTGRLAGAALVLGLVTALARRRRAA